MKYTLEQVLELLKKHSEHTEQWVYDARKQSRTLKALVTGEGFHDELIKHIEHLESEDRAKVRRKYSKDIRDLFARVTRKRHNVFEANGGSTYSEIKSSKILETFNKRITDFKGGKSLIDYMAEVYFQLADIDPNGLIFLEYKLKGIDYTLYPTYKSIEDIRYYECNGQTVDYVLFEPVIKENTNFKLWRFVDSENDYTFLDTGGVFTLVPDKTFPHPFGKVPAVILSEKQKVGSKVRLSPINDIVELAKDYARDKSILTIYKFQKGSPLHWRYGSVKCKECNGLGKKGDKKCSTCDGTGKPLKVDVSDINYIPLPQDGQPFIGDKIGGFISPDLETWKQYKDDLRDAENLIEDTLWGTEKTKQAEFSNETATGRYIDVQPITNVLNYYSDVAQHVYNTLANYVLNFTDQTKDKDKKDYYMTFGRNFIIESPSTLLDKYGKAKQNGDNNTILDKLLQEIILSKYKSDPKMQEQMLKKAKVEPYVHLSIEQVNSIFGAQEAKKKVVFVGFWQQANKDKDTTELKKEFNQYLKTIENESM